MPYSLVCLDSSPPWGLGFCFRGEPRFWLCSAGLFRKTTNPQVPISNSQFPRVRVLGSSELEVGDLTRSLMPPMWRPAPAVPHGLLEARHSASPARGKSAAV